MNSKSARALNLLAGEPLVKDMTLRDWFTGQALAGVSSDTSLTITEAANMARALAIEVMNLRAKEST